MASATILQSALCRTTAKFRPSPSLFYFPGLTSRPVYDAKALLEQSEAAEAKVQWHGFDWLARLRAQHETIKAEYLGLRDQKIPSDYLVTDQEHQLHEGSWEWHSYMQKGQVNKFFEMHCPATAAFFGDLGRRQQLMTGVPLSYAFFSTLKAGAKIQAHSAPANLRLRIHYPLLVPPEAGSDACGMRIGGETMAWTEGEALVFDDSYEHEVWNTTDQDRVVLLFDVWHPDLEYGEREAVKDMFQHARVQGWLK